MYQPAVNLTKPIHIVSQKLKPIHHRVGGKADATRTDDAKEDLGFAEPTRRLVPILEHLEHGRHLPTGVHRLVLDNHELILRRAVDLDDLVERVGRVGRDDVEPRPVLVQDELVARQTAAAVAVTVTAAGGGTAR